MIDDLESKMIDEEKPRSTSNKFIMTEFNLANEQANENII